MANMERAGQTNRQELLSPPPSPSSKEYFTPILLWLKLFSGYFQLNAVSSQMVTHKEGRT